MGTSQCPIEYVYEITVADFEQISNVATGSQMQETLHELIGVTFEGGSELTMSGHWYGGCQRIRLSRKDSSLMEQRKLD